MAEFDFEDDLDMLKNQGIYKVPENQTHTPKIVKPLNEIITYAKNKNKTLDELIELIKATWNLRELFDTMGEG